MERGILAVQTAAVPGREAAFLDGTVVQRRARARDPRDTGLRVVPALPGALASPLAAAGHAEEWASYLAVYEIGGPGPRRGAHRAPRARPRRPPHDERRRGHDALPIPALRADRRAPVTSPVVVTGAAGFIGSHVDQGARRAGRRRRVRPTSPRSSLRPCSRGLDTSRVRMSQETSTRGDPGRPRSKPQGAGESRSRRRLAPLRGDGVGPRAGAPSFPGGARGVRRQRDGDVAVVLEFATEGRLARFVYVSTRSVFGAVQVDGDTIAETCPPSPVGIYGSSKTAAEFGLLAFRDVFGLDLAVARVTGVFGALAGGVSWIGNAVEGVIAGTGTGSASGSEDRYEFTYVKDTVRGLSELVHDRRSRTRSTTCPRATCTASARSRMPSRAGPRGDRRVRPRLPARDADPAAARGGGWTRSWASRAVGLERAIPTTSSRAHRRLRR